MVSVESFIKGLKFYKINGINIPRIKIPNKNICEGCGKNSGYHELGCPKEPIRCKNHKFALECDCDIDSGEPV